MNRLPIAAALLAIALAGAIPASAADRTIGIGTFDRIRVTGGFDVRIATGRAPRAGVSADAALLDLIDLRVEGTTLLIRLRSTGSGPARRAASPVVVTLSAQELQSATMLGGGKLTIMGMRTTRADLSVTGTATITVDGIEAQQANASVIGGGAITLAGRAAHVRLSTNGPGAIDAGRLVADELVVRLDGPGETLAQARYLAMVDSTGSGRVVVTGNAKCTVRSPAGGVVVCGR